VTARVSSRPKVQERGTNSGGGVNFDDAVITRGQAVASSQVDERFLHRLLAWAFDVLVERSSPNTWSRTKDGSAGQVPLRRQLGPSTFIHVEGVAFVTSHQRFEYDRYMITSVSGTFLFDSAFFFLPIPVYLL
jgi:hypothetical protein